MDVELTPLTLVFSPDFGAVHWDADQEKLIHYRDDGLAGKQIVFEPRVSNEQLKLTFQIGRHSDCWIRIGWRGQDACQNQEWLDSRGYPVMGYYPPITLTFQWMDAKGTWAWSSGWFVIPGGVLTMNGVCERFGKNLDLYLNGRLAAVDGNPEPLFLKDMDRVCLAVVNRDFHRRYDVSCQGKIIIFEFPLDRQSTGRLLWEGPQWPTLPVSVPKTAEAYELDSTESLTGRTWADVAVVLLHGPSNVDNQLWYRAWSLVLIGLLLVGLWLWKR
jgi:hypothetical protein